jgi:outer membrane lipoprotein-sorting protein
MTLLGEALEAIYRSRWSFRTLRVVGTARGEQHRLWVARPDRSRAEEEGQNGTAVIVRNRGRWWMWSPDHGGMFGSDEEVGLGHEGALMHLLDPTPLLGVARLNTMGETEVLGRRAVLVRAVPRSDEEVIEPGWYVGSDGIELAIDLERGVALRAGDTHLNEVTFDEELDPGLFVLEFPEGEQPKESRIVPPRVLDLDEASAVVSFGVLVPSALPDGCRLVRCVVPGEGPPDGVHFAYVVDPGALHNIEISEGPRVAEEERGAWSDWRTLTRDGDELLVREDVGESWYRAMVLLERHGTTAVVSSDLPLETVIGLARSLEPIG